MLSVPETPGKQDRSTVVARLALALPQLIAVGALALLAEIILVPCWLASLALGRLPHWAETYMADVARWYARVMGYMYLLTDDYPTASDDLEYPVRADISPGRLSRIHVLLRIVGNIPAYVIVAVVTAGMPIPLLAGWLAVLVRGRLPYSLHVTFAAVLRYQVRSFAYMALLTDMYPWQLFGDSATGKKPETGSAGYRIVLTAPARALMVAIIILGLPGCLLWLHILGPAFSPPEPENPVAAKALDQLEQLDNNFESQDPDAGFKCGDDYQCAASSLSPSIWSSFSAQLGNIAMPSPALSTELKQVQKEAKAVADDYQIHSEVASSAEGDDPDPYLADPDLSLADPKNAFEMDFGQISQDEETFNSNLEQLELKLEALKYPALSCRYPGKAEFPSL